MIETCPSLIPACDVPFDRFADLLRATSDLPEIGAYKVGASLALEVGLSRLVSTAREITDKPLIYDHQKAATDIPDTAEAFMEVLKTSGIDSVILFPLTGPKTQSAWTASAQAAELDVIVGGHMTHESFLSSDGGYINDGAPSRIYEQAANQGVTSFVVPGTLPDVISSVRASLRSLCPSPTLYSPGFVQQGGNLTAAAHAAGDRWHAIVGRGIYSAASMREAAIELASQLRLP